MKVRCVNDLDNILDAPFTIILFSKEGLFKVEFQFCFVRF